MDLSWNVIHSWPPAGVYRRGLLNACDESPQHPPLDWPDMERFDLEGNDLHGQDVRDVLGAFASLPRISDLGLQSCNLTMDLPDEGDGAMLQQLNPITCQFEVQGHRVKAHLD
eukprot:127771-Amphidinium_carterae.1